MITSAVVFTVHAVRCCCLINQDEGAQGDGREVTPKGACEVALVGWAVWRKGLFVNGVPPLALGNI